MLRQIPPVQLVFALVVVALWSAVWFDREAHDVGRQHVKNAFVPYSRDFSYNSLDDGLAEERIVRAASVERESARQFVERFPKDAALLAIYVRRSRALSNFHRDGPMRSPFVAWSVQIRELPSATPMGMPPGNSGPNFPTSEATDEILRLIGRGRRLEPENTYWDWMEMAALAAGGRDNELPAVLRRASLKADWDDHVANDMRAQGLWNERRRSLFGPAAKTFGYSGTMLPHLSLLRNTTWALCQQVMGLRLQRRDAEALEMGLQVMRLARIIRLKASLPITSASGASYERTIIRRADVPLGKRVKLPFPSQASALATDRESLLFLAQKQSPAGAREIANEWGRLNRWGMDSTPDLFGGLMPRASLERVAWTTRAASYGAMSLPVALLGLIVLSIVAWRFSVSPVSVSRWSQVAGVMLLGGLFAADWIKRAIMLRANPTGPLFCGVGYTAPEEVLEPVGSFLALPSLIWAVVPLWLGTLAFRAAFASYRTKEKLQHVHSHARAEHPIEFLWQGVLWIWRGQERLWSRLAPLWILALAVVPVLAVGWSSTNSNPLLSVLALVISLAVWPVSVGIRQMVIFLRTRQRSAGPARFVAVWCSALRSFVVVSLLVLPILIWAQSRFERDFDRQFAPIERGQMVGAIQKMRGIAMQ